MILVKRAYLSSFYFSVTLLLFIHCPIQSLTTDQLWPQCEDAVTGFCSKNESLPVCPDCSLVECIPKITPFDCPKETFWEEGILWGCCPACTTRLKIGDTCGYDPGDELGANLFDRTRELPCNIKLRENSSETVRITSESWAESQTNQDTYTVPIFHLYECGRDAECTSEQKCKLKDDDIVRCSRDLMEYKEWEVKASDDPPDCQAIPNYPKNGTKMDWDRQCTDIGRFSSVQSKSNRFKPEDPICYDPNGNRIFGESHYGDAEINCLCSRKRWEMEQKLDLDSNDDGFLTPVRNDVTIHCNEKGNFETVQCDNGFCWCMDPLNADRLRATSKVLHENLKEQLPCVGSSGKPYLKRCESRTITKAKVKTKMLRHGLDWQEQRSAVVVCDYDGSFAPINYDTNGIKSCMDKINQPIGNYKQVGQKKDMDCLCARNSKSLQCDGQGSYKEFQTFQDIKYCVDQDGFRKTRQYALSDDRQCRIPKCECAFGDTVEGCTPDTTEACRVCDPITTYCYECEECEETDCN